MRVLPPEEIFMIDEMSCTTCVTFQILYMFGFESPPFDAHDMDRRISRPPGQGCEYGGYILEFLRFGLALTEISAIDTPPSSGPMDMNTLFDSSKRKYLNW